MEMFECGGGWILKRRRGLFPRERGKHNHPLPHPQQQARARAGGDFVKGDFRGRCEGGGYEVAAVAAPTIVVGGRLWGGGRPREGWGFVEKALNPRAAMPQKWLSDTDDPGVRVRNRMQARRMGWGVGHLEVDEGAVGDGVELVEVPRRRPHHDGPLGKRTGRGAVILGDTNRELGIGRK